MNKPVSSRKIHVFLDKFLSFLVPKGFLITNPQKCHSKSFFFRKNSYFIQMDKKSSTMKLDDLHSPRGLSKEMKSSVFKKKKNHLPDKDKQFLEEIMKRKTESLGKNLKNPGFQLVSEGNKLRGASESMQKPRIEKKIEKFTSSNFSNAETRAKNSSNFEKNNQDLKYFIGAGNNDALINKIFNTIHG